MNTEADLLWMLVIILGAMCVGLAWALERMATQRDLWLNAYNSPRERWDNHQKAEWADAIRLAKERDPSFPDDPYYVPQTPGHAPLKSCVLCGRYVVGPKCWNCGAPIETVPPPPPPPVKPPPDYQQGHIG